MTVAESGRDAPHASRTGTGHRAPRSLLPQAVVPRGALKCEPPLVRISVLGGHQRGLEPAPANPVLGGLHPIYSRAAQRLAPAHPSGRGPHHDTLPVISADEAGHCGAHEPSSRPLTSGSVGLVASSGRRTEFSGRTGARRRDHDEGRADPLQEGGHRGARHGRDPGLRVAAGSAGSHRRVRVRPAGRSVDGERVAIPATAGRAP
jgi:hypothetical protein